MAKFRPPIYPYYDPAPCLAIMHVYCPGAGLGPLPQWHVVMLWDAWFFNPFELLVPVPWTQLGDYDPYTATPEQLEVTAALVANPVLISHQCPECNARFGVPRHTNWADEPGRSYPYRVPACPYDGSYEPVLWTPDQWPPIFAP